MTLRLDRGGTSSTGPYALRVDGVDVGTVAPLSGGVGWSWCAGSKALGIPWRHVRQPGNFHEVKAAALAYVRKCIAKKEGAS